MAMAAGGVSPVELWVVLTPSENARLHEERAISPSLFELGKSTTFWWLFQQACALPNHNFCAPEVLILMQVERTPEVSKIVCTLEA